MVVILMKWWKESNTKHHQRENSENEKERENVQTHTSWCLSKGKRHRIGCRCDRKLKTEKWKPQESLFLIHSSQEKPNGDFPLKMKKGHLYTWATLTGGEKGWRPWRVLWAKTVTATGRGHGGWSCNSHRWWGALIGGHGPWADAHGVRHRLGGKWA